MLLRDLMSLLNISCVRMYIKLYKYNKYIMEAEFIIKLVARYLKYGN